MQVRTERKDMAYFVQCRKRTFRHVWKLFFEKTDIAVIDFYIFNLFPKHYIAAYLYHTIFFRLYIELKLFTNVIYLGSLTLCIWIRYQLPTKHIIKNDKPISV